jgi:hypothetical protein
MPLNDSPLYQRTREQMSRTRDQVTKLRASAQDVVDRMPASTASDLRESMARLKNTRSPREALGVLELEIESIFETIAPALVEFPLPVRTETAALATVTVTAGTAAAIDEIELLAMLLPGTHVVAAPSLPLVLAASFLSLVLEAYVAGSFRVHQLRDADRSVDPHEVTRDVLRAMTGRDDVTFTKTAAKSLSRRMLRRWGRGIVPFVGIAYSSWDARKTIRAVAKMPLPPIRLVPVSNLAPRYT